ncbi:hypothetical protein Tsubulata_047699, partial [Turnera subulata]
SRSGQGRPRRQRRLQSGGEQRRRTGRLGGGLQRRRRLRATLLVGSSAGLQGTASYSLDRRRRRIKEEGRGLGGAAYGGRRRGKVR